MSDIPTSLLILCGVKKASYSGADGADEGGVFLLVTVFAVDMQRDDIAKVSKIQISLY